MSTQEAVLSMFVVATVLGIPLLGLTLRFSIKPFVDAWLRLRASQSHTPAGEMEALRARIVHLEHVLDVHGLLERPSQVSRSTSELPSHVSAPRERV
ncbi:hypothetical protein DRW03_25340 [Corallococcus sp. H22C18031201]|uniref:hypothetical protein n=1 Tax=Citreicoccus inhibens TaxID=2849499 RepID=UPI000E73EAF6|nr:hypothetical protein [Citreicoccus inhibens]MBU8898976.1 hypothetical protein [Citreicoccus inhibens]RJS18448.1 hypothetical protein DRW03_25340 [Corallococcus sp. H22C18031201]